MTARLVPFTVNGLILAASLVLLAHRPAGRRSGWLSWAAVTIGTIASLAANIATADASTVSRIIAGWPAVALLIAVKLLSGILAHGAAAADGPARIPADAQPAIPRPALYWIQQLAARRLAVLAAPVPRSAVPGLPPGRTVHHPQESSPTTSPHLSRPPAPRGTSCSGRDGVSHATPSPHGSAPLATRSASPALLRSWPPSKLTQQQGPSRARGRHVLPGHPCK